MLLFGTDNSAQAPLLLLVEGRGIGNGLADLAVAGLKFAQHE